MKFDSKLKCVCGIYRLTYYAGNYGKVIKYVVTGRYFKYCALN